MTLPAIIIKTERKHGVFRLKTSYYNSMRKNKNALLLLAYIVISFFFLLLWVNVEKKLLYNTGVTDWIIRILIIAALFFVYKFVFSFFAKHEAFLARHKHILLWSFLVVFFVAQICIGNQLRIIPLYDFKSVYIGAVDWVVTGDFVQFKEYFYYYPNNLGELFFLRTLFLTGSKFGITDFYLLGMIVNALSCVGAIAFVFYTLDMKLGCKEGFFAVLLFALTPPMWLTASVFYTDSLTMIFPAAMYFLYTLAGKYKKNLHKCLLMGLMILLGMVGYFLKPTVLIILIAIIIDLLLQKKWKQTVTTIAVWGALFFIMTNLFHSIFYPRYLDEEKAEQLNTPYETWVYMGLNDEFGFSGDDTAYSRSFYDPAIRKQKMREAIAERINQRGVLGTIRHEFKKLVAAYSDGTFELSYSFQFGLEKETWLENYVTLLGDNYPIYWNLCAIFYYEILFLAALSTSAICYKLVRKKEYLTAQSCFPPILALFGLDLFLMIWEVHYRYTINYYPVLIMIAMLGCANYFKRRK